MNGTLSDRTIALAEGRQLEELAQMLEKEGARTLRCPMLSILDAPDEKPVLDWLGELIADRFAWVVLLTGEGVRRFLACAERHGLREQAIEALGRVKTMTRGPKPVQALREVGLTPTLVAKTPTTDGVIAALRDVKLSGEVVGVQLYSDSNPPLTQFLTDAGATVRTVQPYVYAPASDAERVVALIRQMDSGGVDAVVFTSSPQVDRLCEVARDQQLTSVLLSGLKRTQVAAVGPLVAENLQRRGVTVAIMPEQGFVMKNLVQLIKRALGSPA